jgi:hypothetical protein
MTPRKSSSQSQAAIALNEKRSKQHEDVISIADALEECIAKAEKMHSQYVLLSSVSKGLYDELDKLSKKAPAEPVTDLVLTQVNDVIREIKELAKDDLYVQRLNEFVAAGDNPEHRDVVVVLRQLRQGLERFETTINPRIADFNHKQNEAHTIQLALQLFIEGNSDFTYSDMEDYGLVLSDVWFIGYISKRTFNWDRLDRTDLHAYFPKCD